MNKGLWFVIGFIFGPIVFGGILKPEENPQIGSIPIWVIAIIGGIIGLILCEIIQVIMRKFKI
jgi:hypothetical protein